MAQAELLEYRVKLRSAAGELVIFNVTPDLSETRSVNYKTVDPVHAPGQIFAFVNSTSRTYSLSGVKLVSRNRAEAERNLRYLWLLRSWCLPAFGQDPLTEDQRENRRNIANYHNIFSSREDGGRDKFRNHEQAARGGKSEADYYGTDLRGAPPQVLELSAYAHDGHIGTQIGHINRVPTVITSLTIPYPSDVDYFPTSNGVPMPAVMMIDISLSETHSPKEYEQFNLSSYKKGLLRGF